MTECHTLFCIASAHDDDTHVDVTGHTWREPLAPSPVQAHLLVIFDELVPFGPEDFDRLRAGMDAGMTDTNETTTETETTEVTVEKPAKETETVTTTETTEAPAE